MSVLFRYLIVIILLGTGCTPKSQFELSKALSNAVKEEKISQKKMASILIEYDVLRDHDNAKAREYALKVISALEMGGDSSHLEVVRTQFAPVRKGV